MLKPATLLFCAFIAATVSADTVVKANADISNSASAHPIGSPVVGDYTFTFGKSQACVTSPNGKRFILDFDNKTFTSIDPSLLTFYQVPIEEVLALGNQVPSAAGGSGRVDGSFSFEPNSSGAPMPALVLPAKPYRVSLESTLILKGGSPGGFGGGLSPKGGLVFSGAPSGQTSSVSAKRRLGGQLWMGDAPSGVDRDQMNTAVECVLLWGSPQLKELANRVHKSDLTILGGMFSVTMEGQRDYVLGPPPVISIKVTSSQPGTLDTSSLAIPNGYRRVSPPGSPFGR